MAHNKQIVITFSLAILLGITRFIFLDDPDFSLIKKERIIKDITTFFVPENMTEPMMISLEFAKYLFDDKSAVFIDARDAEDYEAGHIENAISIPFDYYEDYEQVMDGLNDAGIYIIYCSGEECSLSIDLADHLFNQKLIDKLLIFDGGWPEWRDSGYP